MSDWRQRLIDGTSYLFQRMASDLMHIFAFRETSSQLPVRSSANNVGECEKLKTRILSSTAAEGQQRLNPLRLVIHLSFDVEHRTPSPLMIAKNQIRSIF